MSETPASDAPAVGSLIKQLAEVRKQITKLTDQLNDHKRDKAALEEQLMDSFRAQGVQRVAIDGYTVSLTQQVVPNIKDWGEFSRYVLDNEALYLLQRRLSPGPYRDLLEKGEQVPGLEPFTAESISFRTTG